jgi:phosphate acetyltransferase
MHADEHIALVPQSHPCRRSHSSSRCGLRPRRIPQRSLHSIARQQWRRYPIFSGTAQLLAPPVKLRWSTLPVPKLIVNDPYRRYHGLIARATSKPPVKTAIAWPCDEVSLGGAIQAFKDKLIVPVLVGSEAKIRSLAETMQLDLETIQIVDVDDSRTAAVRAVEMARKTRCKCS